MVYGSIDCERPAASINSLKRLCICQRRKEKLFIASSVLFILDYLPVILVLQLLTLVSYLSVYRRSWLLTHFAIRYLLSVICLCFFWLLSSFLQTDSKCCVSVPISFIIHSSKSQFRVAKLFLDVPPKLLLGPIESLPATTSCINKCDCASEYERATSMNASEY